MCTNDDVRDAVIDTRLPGWFTYFMGGSGALAVLFIGWLAVSVHEQPEKLATELGKVRLDNALLNSQLLGKIEALSSQLESVVFDNWTHSKAIARNRLMDERSYQFDRRLTTIEIELDAIKEFDYENY